MATKAYNPAWARNTAVRQAAARWQRLGLVTPEQYATIESAHPLDYYRPPLFLRIGLFIFASLGSLAVAGVVGMISEFSLVFMCLACGLGAFLLLENAIRNSPRHYHSGFDNAMLYTGLLAAAVLLGYCYHQLLAGNRLYYQGSSGDFDLTAPRFGLFLLPLLALLTWAVRRYADGLVAAAAYLTYLALIVNLLLSFSLGRLLLPFALMLASGAAYAWFRRLERRDDSSYYQSALTLLKTLALVTLYLAGNYLMVREGYGLLTSSFESVPLAPLFYLFTAAIPLAYIGLGLQRHNRPMLLVGLFVVGFAIYTYRHYHSLLPVEVAATLGGFVLIAFAAWAMHYLRTPQHGLTAAADDEHPPHFNLEALIVAQTAPAPATPEAPGFEFGGGSSGGGGATGSF